MNKHFIVYQPQNDRVAAMMLGFAKASGQYTVIMDTDMAPAFLFQRAGWVLKVCLSVMKQGGEKLPRSISQFKRVLLFRRLEAYFLENQDKVFLVWNGTKGVRKVAVEAAKSAGVQTIFMELAPIPQKISIDRKGVNYGSSLPRNPHFFSTWRKTVAIEENWGAIAEKITPRGLQRVIKGRSDEVTSYELPQHYIFCPLQVPGDSQITEYGGWIESVEQFFEEVVIASKYLPENWGVVVKQHPSSEEGLNSQNGWEEDNVFNGDAILTTELIEKASLVVTVNSSVGLEASLFDKPVVVLGQAIYGIEGFCRFASDAVALRSVFENPQAVDFDRSIRLALIGYFQQEYFFEEHEIVEGRVKLAAVIERDQRAKEVIDLL